MKFTLFVFSLFLTYGACSQNSIEFYSGLGICNVHNSNNGGTADARLSYQFGTQYGMVLAEKWQLKSGVEFANYGSRQAETSIGGITYKSLYASNYIEIPLTIGYRIGSDFVITPFISSKFGFNVLAKNKVWIAGADPYKEDYSNFTKTFNFSASIGCEFAQKFGAFEAFSLVEYRQGISSIFEDTDFFTDQNRFVNGRLTFGLRYSFIPIDKN